MIGTLDFQLSRNTGASFSLFQGKAFVLVPVAVVLVGALLVMAWRAPSAGRAAILGLILGGALGNLADRFFRDDHGAVVDFVALHFWPTFNVADASHRGGLHPAVDLPGPGAPAVVTVLTVTVPASLDGVRVDKAVSLVADLSRSTVNSLVEQGRVRIDGVVVRSRSTALRLGQELRVDRDAEASPAAPVGDPDGIGSTWSTRTPT